MSILLEVGEVVAAPPAGKRILRLDDSGAAVLVASDGTEDIIDGATPAEAAKLADFDYDGWLQTQIATMKLAAPTCTQFREVPIRTHATNIPGAGWISADGKMEGGSLSSPNTSTAAIMGTSAWQTPATTPWAFAVRGLLATPTAGQYNAFGGYNLAITHTIAVATYFTASDGFYLIYTADAQEVIEIGTVACDDLVHDFVLGFDGTVLKLYVDGVLAATQDDLTGMTDEPMFLSTTNVATLDANACRAAIGYIAP